MRKIPWCCLVPPLSCSSFSYWRRQRRQSQCCQYGKCRCEASGMFAFYHLSCHRCLSGSLCGSSRTFTLMKMATVTVTLWCYCSPQTVRLSPVYSVPSIHLQCDRHLTSFISPVVAKIFNGFSFVSFLLYARFRAIWCFCYKIKTWYVLLVFRV